MALAMGQGRTSDRVDVIRTSALRHWGFSAATATAGVALAVLVGHDGTLAWQLARVAGVAASRPQ